MPTSTFIQPDFGSQIANQYFPNIDSAISVMARVAAAFAPHQTAPATLDVVVDSGPFFAGTMLVEIPAQTVTIAPPVADSRIDRIVIDRMTGTISVVAGTAAPSPTAPAIPSGTMPIAQVLSDSTTTQITNLLITDERAFVPFQVSSGGLLNVQSFTTSGTYTPTAGTTSIIVEVIGGGGGGGGCAAPSSGQASASSGGGGGAYARARFTSGFAGVAVTVGAGGAVSSAGAVNGNVGGASSFGSLVSAPGGFAGFAGASVSGPNFTGRSGATQSPTGGNLIFCSGASSGEGTVYSSTRSLGGYGGRSVYGAGSVGGTNGNGGSPTNPGGGGGGCASIAGNPARSGGGGADGLVLVYEYA